MIFIFVVSNLALPITLDNLLHLKSSKDVSIGSGYVCRDFLVSSLVMYQLGWELYWVVARSSVIAYINESDSLLFDFSKF